MDKDSTEDTNGGLGSSVNNVEEIGAATAPSADSADHLDNEVGQQVLGREHYGNIEKALRYQFKDLGSLELALTHRSMQGKGSRSDYERLEFLGDAVLDLAVAELLLKAYPEAREGQLSKMRAALVNTNMLADVARSLNIGPYVRLSRGELASGGADRSSILADVFEATMGAIYRESGFDVALSCIQHLFDEKIRTITPTDPKTELQEALHASGFEMPEYLLEYVEGPEHAPAFVSVVRVGKQIVGRGRGPTKKASHQAAAAEALAGLKVFESGDSSSVFASIKGGAVREKHVPENGL